MLFFILAIFAGYMVNSFLSFAATNEFKIEYLKIGPTEIRILFIIINTLIIFFGKTYMAWALPYALVFSLIGLIYIVCNTQKYIWKYILQGEATEGGINGVYCEQRTETCRTKQSRRYGCRSGQH